MSLSQKIKKIIDNLDDVITVSIADATNQVFTDVDERVFRQGKAVDGGKIGSYKNGYWKKTRTKTGKQVGFVDLDFTGALERSVQRNDTTVFFSNEYGEIVGRGNEDYYRGGGARGAGHGEIFAPTAEEKKKAVQIIRHHVHELFK